MKKRVLAMIAAITVAAGSLTVGGTSYAAEEISFEEEIVIEDDVIEDAEAPEDYETVPYDEAGEDASDENSEEVTEAPESEEIFVEEEGSEASDFASTDSSEEEMILEESELTYGKLNPALYAGAVKGRWINKKNKWTYENARGEAKDDDGKSLDDTVAHIGDNFYYFKDGYMCTGFVYFDEAGSFTVSKKANSARYCDTMSGIIKTGMFAVNGKDYYGQSDEKAYGLIRYNTIFKYNSKYYYADKTGAILKGKGFSLNGKSYYASEEGPLLYSDRYLIIDGKYYRFNEDYSISSVEDEMQIFYYAAKKNGKTEAAQAYLLNKNPNKPEEGRCFFADTDRKKMLTSCWIYYPREIVEKNKMYYLDKNGEMVTGLTKIGSKYYLFGESGANNSTVYQQSYEGIYRKKDGTTCFILNGVMVTKKGFFYNKFQHSYYYVLNKSGELAQGDVFIKTKQYPKGKRYSFDSYCCLRVNDYSVNFVKHVVNHSNYENPEIKGPEDHFVLTNDAEVEKFLTTPEGDAYKDFAFDTDGTLLNGLKTVDGKKYLYFQGEPAHYNKVFNLTPPFVMIVDEKCYLIGEGSAVTSGWFRIPEEGLLRTSFSGGYAIMSGAYLYFSPDDACAVTGIATVPVPKLDKNGDIVLDSAGNVVTTGKKAELCFATRVSRNPYLHEGFLVRNSKYVVDGKAYVTDGAGVAKLLEEGAVSEEGETIYRNADGSKATGRIDGSYYDPSTGYQLKNVIRCSSKKWYYYGKDGKESTALTEVTLDDDSTAFVTYKKDGSISGFKYENGKKVSGRAFTLGASYYFIGKNGTLTTGVISQKLISKDVDVFTYVESDGLCYYKRSVYANKTFLFMLGKKIYVMQGGEPVKDSTKAYEVSDFSRLPKAELAVLEKYQGQHCIYSPIRYTGELEDYNLPIYVNDDGSVFEGTMNRGESVVHIKYGVCLEDLSPFRREGKEWYYTAATEAGSMAWETYTLNNRGSYSIKRTMTFSWDNNMKLGKFMDASTGKPVSGDCICYYDAPSTGEKMELYFCFKDGKLVTGKRVYRIASRSITFYYDPDTGAIDYMDFYRNIIKNL